MQQLKHIIFQDLLNEPRIQVFQESTDLSVGQIPFRKKIWKLKDVPDEHQCVSTYDLKILLNSEAFILENHASSTNFACH